MIRIIGEENQQMEECSDIFDEEDEHSATATEKYLLNYTAYVEDSQNGDAKEDVSPVINMRKLVTPKLKWQAKTLSFHD